LERNLVCATSRSITNSTRKNFSLTHTLSL
jgi:hypothetical protein